VCETALPRVTEGASSVQDQPTAIDVAWAAGLFEGEGNLTLRGKSSAEAVIGMTDRDVIEHFLTVVGFGNLTCERRSNPRHNNVYRWSASNATDVRILIEMFLPFLGERRRQRALEVLAFTENCPGARRTRTACRQGHPYNDTDTHTLPSGYRVCKICRRERNRERLAANPALRERNRQKAAEWRAANPEEARARKRASYRRRKKE
jgi:hypothetical protein